MVRNIFRRSLLLSVGALAVSFAAPALAGRGTQIDVLNGVSACSLGSTSCSGFDVHASGVFSTAYVYQEGIVSFDALLPVGATSGDPSSLGSGAWFAAGFSSGATYGVSVFVSNPGYPFAPAYAFNFYAPGANIYGTLDDPSTPDIDETVFPDSPLFQVQLFSTDGSYDVYDPSLYSETGVGFGYAPGGQPLANALIGFSVLGTTETVYNTNGLLVGPATSDTDFLTTFGRYVPASGGDPLYDADGNPLTDDEGNQLFSDYIPESRTSPSLFTALYGPYTAPIADVPEPSTWGLMLMGMALLGGLSRQRNGKARPVAA